MIRPGPVRDDGLSVLDGRTGGAENWGLREGCLALRGGGPTESQDPRPDSFSKCGQPACWRSQTGPSATRGESVRGGLEDG